MNCIHGKAKECRYENKFRYQNRFSSLAVNVGKWKKEEGRNSESSRERKESKGI